MIGPEPTQQNTQAPNGGDADHHRAERCLALIGQQIDQEHTSDVDALDDPGFHKRLLATLPASRVIRIWEEGQVRAFIRKTAPKRERRLAQGTCHATIATLAKAGVDRAIAQWAVLFVFGGRAPEDPPKAELARAANIAMVYQRLASILSHGVLSPAELRRRHVGHTPSSDLMAEDHISAFDIDWDRNADDHYEERFPLPGHQSISPVLERQHDIATLGRQMLQGARDGRRIALRHLDAMQVHHDDTSEAADYIGKVQAEPALLQELGWRARFDAGGMRALATRAQRSAMVVSSGPALTRSWSADFLKLPGLGPRVAELRAPATIEPRDITHVLLPDCMRGFPPLRQWDVTVLFVDTVAAQVSYWDHASRLHREFTLAIPNYQAALDGLAASGVRKMLTHITKA